MTAPKGEQSDRVAMASLDQKGNVAQVDPEYVTPSGKDESVPTRRAVNAKAEKEREQLQEVREFVQATGGPGSVVGPTVPSDPDDTRTAVDVMEEVSGQPGEQPGPADVPPAPATAPAPTPEPPAPKPEK